MAIKGKGKSGKRRGVAAAPKPVYVQPKMPLLSRRGFRIGALVMIAVVAIGSITAALVVKHNSNKEEALKKVETGIVRRFGAAMDNALSGVGQPFQTTFTPFPTFTTEVTDFQSGKLPAEKAEKKAETYAADAKAAAADITQIPAADLIRGHPDLLPLNDGQNMVADALQVYEQAADSFKLAVQTSGKDRAELVAHTTALLAVASKLFNDGYQKLINERQVFDLLAPVNQVGAPPATAPGTGGG